MTQLDVRCSYCGSKSQYVKSFVTDDYNQACVRAIDFSCQSCQEEYSLAFSSTAKKEEEAKKMRNYGLGAALALGFTALLALYWRSNAKSPADFVHLATTEPSSIYYTTKKSQAEKDQEKADEYLDQEKSPAQLFEATKNAALLHPSVFGPEF